MIKNHQRINSDSGVFEYYTPPNIIEAARATMGWIDLDPATSRVANRYVKAGMAFFYDGENRPWFGRVWLNHPFGRGLNRIWIGKLLDEYKNGNIKCACCITYASTSERWFKPLLDFPQCFLTGRTNYFLPDGSLKKGATKGSVVTYLGDDQWKFALEFAQLGTIKVRL
jgi:hypothetical protein